MNVVFCTDNNYAMPCGVSMLSLLENNKSTTMSVYIIGKELSEENKRLLTSVAEQYNAPISIYDISNELFQKYNLSVYDSQHISLSAYSRLFISGILPNDVDKILYLDSDIIVNKDLSDLWNTDIENYSVAGVPDIPLIVTYGKEHFENLNFSNSHEYINSGVLLINLKYWREQNVEKEFLNYLVKNHDKIKYHDQDILNGCLYKSIFLLPIKYNMQESIYQYSTKYGVYTEEVESVLTDPDISHFSGALKPWKKRSLHPLRETFHYYKNVSPWKETPLTSDNVPLRRIIRHYKRSLLYKLGLKKPQYICLLNK